MLAVSGRAIEEPTFEGAIVDEVACGFGFSSVEELHAARGRVGVLVNADHEVWEVQKKWS